MVLKALVCISNYGTKNETFIDRVISECQGFSFETDIHIDTTQDYSRKFPSVSQRFFDMSVKEDLVFKHREIFCKYQNDYDLFIYTEDDILITEDNINTYLAIIGKLPSTDITGFIRYEYKSGDTKTKYLIDVHPNFPTIRKNPVSIDGSEYFTLENLHQGCYVLTREQLHTAISSGNYLVPPHTAFKGKQGYGKLECGASDVFINCGFNWKVFPKDHIEDLLVHHLPDLYVNTGGIWDVPGPFSVEEFVAGLDVPQDNYSLKEFHYALRHKIKSLRRRS